MNIKMPSMYIYRDKISVLNGTDVARKKCMELSLASCVGKASSEEVICTTRGILGLGK